MRNDAKHTVIFYESKALEYYALGATLVEGGQPDSARAAYQAALTEDLSFFQAHVGLSEIARDAGESQGRAR